ncbi:uncharacterized protein V1518DRAFT_414807 [Limtongia smithiae]|uniref:uncharacterized protein n=1 Tax=Limtongia smithiae TaxID=1125753 RepID=UPI0034CD1B84
MNTTAPAPPLPTRRGAALNGHATSPAASAAAVTAPVLTGQQEHYLKKELISLQLERELDALSEPEALRRFGAPFKCDVNRIGKDALESGRAAAAAAAPNGAPANWSVNGKSKWSARTGLFGRGSATAAATEELVEISPEYSDFPILRHVFINYVRNFPFLDQSREVEFWQDRVQKFWESFAMKRISSSNDRTEETKRRRLVYKIQKMIEIMMSSGIRTSSGFEKGIVIDDTNLGMTTTDLAERMEATTLTDEESEAVEREKFMADNATTGRPVNGFDINVVSVRVVYDKARVRSKSHLEFIVATRRDKALEDVYVSRRYSEFRELHQHLLHTFPEKNLPRLPMKNKAASFFSDDAHSAPASADPSVMDFAEDGDEKDDDAGSGDDEDNDMDSMSPRSSMSHGASISSTSSGNSADGNSPAAHKRVALPKKITHRLSKASLTKLKTLSEPALPSNSTIASPISPARDHHDVDTTKLVGELQRLSLRAFLRALAQIQVVAESDIFRDFLTDRSFGLVEVTPAESDDIQRRRDADKMRLEEQFKFFQIASKRARELDHYMADFRKDLIQRDGLSRFFAEIKEKERLKDLSPQYQKFVEWGRIEIAATIYHLFVGQDNASDLLAQTKRIHRLMPYAILKNVIRFSNPVSMMKAVLDLFLAQPFGQKSLLQRILYIVLYEDVKVQEAATQVVRRKVGNDALCDRIQKYVDSEPEIHEQVNWEADDEDIDIIVAISKTDMIDPPLDVEVIGRIINSWIAWNIAVEDPSIEVTEDVRFFSNLKSLLKLMIRKRDKDQILSLTGERVTMDLMKDVFSMFYQPLVKVYKNASVHNSITDISSFVDDLIKVVESCNSETTSQDANVLVQKFVDLCERHQESFFRFVHDVHVHDNGLFTKLMVWIEEILQFLRDGPGKTIDIVQLFALSTSSSGSVDGKVLVSEIDSMIAWNRDRKLWREKRLRDRIREGKGIVGVHDDSDVDSDGERAEADDEVEWKATIPQLLKVEDFGLRDDDVEQFAADQSNLSSDEEQEEDDDLLDPIEYERRARLRRRNRASGGGGRSGEPPKPELVELPKLMDMFVDRLREVLA